MKIIMILMILTLLMRLMAKVVLVFALEFSLKVVLIMVTLLGSNLYLWNSNSSSLKLSKQYQMDLMLIFNKYSVFTHIVDKEVCK